MDLFKYYVKEESSGVSGHFVKLFIPSSFHTKSIFKTVPFPTQFEMKSPLLISLKFKMNYHYDKTLYYEFDVKPSVYHSHIFSNEILNLGDCKRVGVYYEQKTVASYPFLAGINFKTSGNFSFTYKLSNLPKTIVSHRSEAGTYSGKDYLAPLPTQERKTIMTRPTQFKYPVSFNYLGMPKFSGEIKTEGASFKIDPFKRNWQETALYIHRLFTNAGWRRRSIEIQRDSDSVIRQKSDELEYEFNYWRQYYYSSKKGSEMNWSRGLKFDDEMPWKSYSNYAAEGREMYEKIKTLSHIKDNLEFKIHRTSSRHVQKEAISLEYYHTFGGYLHLVHLNGYSTSLLPIVINVDYATGFINMPNEFKYKQKYDQKGLAIAAVSFKSSYPFLAPDVISKALFNYKPLGEVLPLEEQVIFEPDTHQECLNDIDEGAANSPACTKAIREKSIFNHLRMHTLWSLDIDALVKAIGKYFESELRNEYFPHVTVTEKPLNETGNPAELRIDAVYIDKMTDEPAINVEIDKEMETVNYRMISAEGMRPLSSIDSLYETYARAYTNNTYPATCSLTGNYVRTYDMKVYEMAKHNCSYVLTTHCTEHKKFAVIVKRSRSKVTEVQVHLGEDKIILKPGTGSSYPVQFNSEQHIIHTLQHEMLNESALISAQMFLRSDYSSYVQIEAGKAGVKVLFDGTFVKVQVKPRYKGELCGLCSEYNGEVSREFRGPDRCLYLSGEGLSLASIVGRCGGQSFKVPRLCDDEDLRGPWARTDTASEEDSREGYEPSTKRNIVTSQGNNVCFSTKPVSVCVNGAQPKMTESRHVNFHCLPKRNLHARKLVAESKRRILGELETKAVDYSASFEVVKMC